MISSWYLFDILISWMGIKICRLMLYHIISNFSNEWLNFSMQEIWALRYIISSTACIVRKDNLIIWNIRLQLFLQMKNRFPDNKNASFHTMLFTQLHMQLYKILKQRKFEWLFLFNEILYHLLISFDIKKIIFNFYTRKRFWTLYNLIDIDSRLLDILVNVIYSPTYLTRKEI